MNVSGARKRSHRTLDKTKHFDSNESDSERCGTSSVSRVIGHSERRLVMAPADIAAASTRTDSIKGLAQSIAKPAYRRLLNAEPALRRAVPVLIIAFLLTMAVSALVQVNDHRRQAVANIVRNLELTADLGAERLGGDNRLTNSDLAK